MIGQIIMWWLVVQGIGLLSLPITIFFLHALPDRGYALSKTLGLLLMSYGAWFIAMLGLLPFGKPLLLFMIVLVGIVGLWAVYQQDHQQRLEQAKNYLRKYWPTIVAYEIIFLGAMIIAAWMRAYHPDPWGTERPMDFAFFNAIQRSATFPPHDPWLAGYSINYYYFGYLMMAALALISGLEPSVAFNLSLAVTFALTALNVASIVSNLMSHTALSPIPSPISRILMMILSVLLILFASNQAGVLQVITGDHRIVAMDTQQLLSATMQSIQGKKKITLPHPVYTRDGDFGTFDTFQRQDQIKDFNWWWPSRALWDDHPDTAFPQGYVRVYNITEFPFFSFWLGDMHPHVMALPFGLLALALTFNLLAQTSLPTFAAHRRGWIELLLTGLILGSLYTINSWDLPTYTILYAGALFLIFVRHNSDPESFPWLRLGIQLLLLAIAMYALFIPFHLTFKSFAGTAEPLTTVPILSKITEIVAPLNCSRSGLHAFLIIFGLFLIPLIAFASFTMRGPNRLVLALLPAGLLLIGLVVKFPLLALAGIAIATFSSAMYHADQPTNAFVLLVVALGSAICFGTDIMFIRDVFNSRMNTIFKFYYQTWLLWSTVTPYAIWWIILKQETAQGEQASQVRMQTHFVGVRWTVVGIFVLLLAGAMVYPVVNVRNMFKHNTLVGLQGKTPRQSTPAGQESLDWLRNNAPPGSVVLEMVAPLGGSYNPEGYAGISAYTGLPTIIGWTGHESQWRRGHKAALDEIQPRKQDVETIYSTPDTEIARNLLEKYGVTYIYVGNLEHQTQPAESLAKFTQIATPVFQKDAITIYKVNP